jgi:hypothetical protein
MDLRKLARSKPCILCGTQGGTTVLAHLNIAGHFGKGLKANDFPRGVWLCHACHTYVDGEGRGDWKIKCRALGQQMERYLTEGVIRLE